jgi:hypothetical protein
VTERVIRRLEPGEIAQLIDWAASEGWNPGPGDAAAFARTGLDNFIGAFVAGEMVSGIAAVAYGTSYGFIGLYICRPDMRGRGHGKAVWEAGMARLAGRTIGLDGVDAQFENYRGKGFAPAYRTIRFGGRLSGAEPGNVQVGAPETVDAEGICRLDRRVFPERRDAFLAHWLAPPHRVAVARADGEVTGYGVLRACRKGWKLGGLAAQDVDTAMALLRHLGGRVEGEIFIDVPAERTGFIARLAAAGLSAGFETTRMYHGGMLPLAPELYGVTTLELG